MRSSKRILLLLQKKKQRSVYRVDIHPPKMLIIQFHTAIVWKNACHTIFVQFRKMV